MNYTSPSSAFIAFPLVYQSFFLVLLYSWQDWNTMDTQFLRSLFGLQGKTAIITGATGGLGSAIALGLAKAGANIVSIEMPNDPLSAALHDLIMQTERQI